MLNQNWTYAIFATIPRKKISKICLLLIDFSGKYAEGDKHMRLKLMYPRNGASKFNSSNKLTVYFMDSSSFTNLEIKNMNLNKLKT